MLPLKAPVHSLRKFKAFRILLNSRWNRPALYDIGFPFPIALRPLTHISLRWNIKEIEPKVWKLVKNLLLMLEKKKDKGCFYDIGANVGLYSWLACSISSNRVAIAFEPDPLNLELLGMTQAQANLENWQVNGIALSDKCGNSHFSQDSVTSATGTLCMDGQPWIEKYLGCRAQTIEVKTSTLDKVIDSMQWPSLIKIDVEGHESAVLNGGIHTLSRHKPLIVLESFPPRKIQVIEFLNNMGYEFLDADCWQPLQESTSNLFAWHPDGPLPRSTIQGLLK